MEIILLHISGGKAGWAPEAFARGVKLINAYPCGVSNNDLEANSQSLY
jgi:hypothetical protein